MTPEDALFLTKRDIDGINVWLSTVFYRAVGSFEAIQLMGELSMVKHLTIDKKELAFALYRAKHIPTIAYCVKKQWIKKEDLRTHAPDYACTLAHYISSVAFIEFFNRGYIQTKVEGVLKRLFDAACSGFNNDLITFLIDKAHFKYVNGPRENIIQSTLFAMACSRRDCDFSLVKLVFRRVTKLTGVNRLYDIDEHGNNLMYHASHHAGRGVLRYFINHTCLEFTETGELGWTYHSVEDKRQLNRDFKPTDDEKKVKLNVFLEELMQVTWKPTRFMRWCMPYDEQMK